MKFVHCHYATIKNCKLMLSNIDKWNSVLMAMDGKKVKVVITDDKETRSNNQNRLYWAYLNLISDETGNNADDLHEYFKRKFLPPRYVKILGNDVKFPATTTKMDSTEFTNYLDKISALTNVSIPNPDEYV